jgi:hypothetical protein
MDPTTAGGAAQIKRTFLLARERQERAAAGHTQNALERKKMAEAHAAKGDEHEPVAGEDTLEQHELMADTHTAAAAAHRTLAEVYGQGDVFDPRDRARYEEAAGERQPQPLILGRDNKPELGEDGQPTGRRGKDLELERERHFWLLRQRKPLTLCDCHVCEGEREKAAREADQRNKRLAMS